MIAAVVLVWLTTSLLVGAAWAFLTYRPLATASTPPPTVVRDLPRPRQARSAPARERETVGSR